MTVRSDLLDAGSVTTSGTWTTVYTAPTGYRTIVKEVRTSQHGATTTSVQVALWRSAALVAYYVLRLAQPQYELVRDEMWQIMKAGDALRVYVGTQPVFYSISGTELSLTGGEV